MCERVCVCVCASVCVCVSKREIERVRQHVNQDFRILRGLPASFQVDVCVGMQDKVRSADSALSVCVRVRVCVCVS